MAPRRILNAYKAGIAVSDLDTLSIGMVLDMCAEALNDQEDYAVIAAQEDFDRF